MRLHLLLMSLFASGSLSFSSAQANEPEWFVPSWYAGASVAYNENDHMGTEASQCDGLNGIIDGLNLGYQFNPYLTTEVEYQYLGCIKAEQISDDLMQGVVSAKFGYPVTDNITPYFKVGAASWGDGVSGVIGAGVSYQVFDDVSFNVEYQFTDSIDSGLIGHVDHQRFSLGIQYRFGYATSRGLVIEQPDERIVQVVEETPQLNSQSSEIKIATAPSYDVNLLNEHPQKRVEEVSQLETVVKMSSHNQTALFNNNSSVIKNAAALSNVVNLLNAYPEKTVVVTGFTDSVGTDKYNLWLSERRARNVGGYIVSQGIRADRIMMKWKGEQEPAANNDTAAGREINRRVSIEFN